MLDKLTVLVATAGSFAPGIIATSAVGAAPSAPDSSICSLVAPAAVRLLAPVDGGFCERHLEQIIAACDESVAGYRCAPAADGASCPYFDVGRLDNREVSAMLLKPAQLERWLRRQDRLGLGNLPLRLLAAQAQLTDALTARDATETVAQAADVIALATQASSPFCTTAPDSALLAETLRVSEGDAGVPAFAGSTVRDRMESELVRRNLERVRFEVRPYRGRMHASTDVGTDTLQALLLAHAALEDLLQTERDILRELQISTPGQLTQEQDRYFDKLTTRCLATVEARLESGAVLAARLMAHAWASAGRSDGGVGSNSRGSITDEKKRDDQRNNEAASAGDLVGSVHSSVVHRPNCPHVKRIHQKNRVHFKSLDRAVQAGRKPCRVCKPD
ncbi:MAG: Ada metal-binding domain-containing protein [Phycisphaerae bacterium]